MTPYKICSWCLLGVSISLILVGIVSGTVLRHGIQVFPMAILAMVVARLKGYGLIASTAMLLAWLIIMILIWLYLLGYSRITTGHYTLAEIILTVIIGLISVFGLITITQSKFGEKWHTLVAAFIAAFATQYGFIIISQKYVYWFGLM